MTEEREDPRAAAAAKRAYAAPTLLRFGTLQEVTQSLGNSGAKDGQQRGNTKRTSY